MDSLPSQQVISSLSQSSSLHETSSYQSILDGTIDACFITRGEFLGAGAFGDVCRGTLQGPGFSRPINVALKEASIARAMTKIGLSKEQVLEALEREVLNLSRLSHPSLVGFYGFSKADPTLQQPQYIVLEFCAGGTLENALLALGKKQLVDLPNATPSSSLSWKLRWQWALELAEGLAFLHHSGIVHRDIKSENILFSDEQGHAKWADLGVASVDALISSEATMVEEHNIKDRYWASPEEALGQPGTAYSDIFSFGLVLWQIATCLPLWSQHHRDIQAVLNTLKQGTEAIKRALPTTEASPQSHAWSMLLDQCWHEHPTK